MKVPKTMLAMAAIAAAGTLTTTTATTSVAHEETPATCHGARAPLCLTSTDTRNRTGTTKDTPPRNCHSAWCERVRTARKVARRIDRTLARYGSPMAGTGALWARAGRRFNVNPYAVLGISGKESSLGKARCGFNATGLGSCGRAWTTTGCVSRMRPLRLAAMTNWKKAINTMTRYFPCRFPDARSLYELHGYCSGCPTWMGDVAYWTRRFGSGPGLKWRHARAAVTAKETTA